MARADRPSVLLRADATLRIGTGHVVRSLALARALVDRGWDATITGRLPSGLARSIRDAGVGVVPLPGDLPADEEPAFLADGGGLGPADVVVVDHYDRGAAWHLAVRGRARLMVAIDDLADRPLAVDLVLNQNLGATRARYRGLVADDAVVLSGPRYALLRPEFATARATLAERSGTVRRILVFLSGSDEHDVTGRAAEAASAGGVEVDVVVGSGYPFRERLLAWAAARPAVRVHVDTPEMPALMASADLAVGAPSTASWERCTLALPSILVILAANQVEVAGFLHRAGAAVTLGWHHEVTTEAMRSAITDLMADPVRLRTMSVAAGAITDGRGAERVADAIESLLAARTSPPASSGDAV